MKKAILLITFLSSFSLFAQKNKPISLSRGQVITITTTSNLDMDMGSGILIKNSSSSTNNVVVTGEDDKNYTISSALNKLVLSSDMMGQQNNYDSDKKDDKDSEIGKTVSEKLGKPVIVFVNKKTGNVVPEKKKEDIKDSVDNNPMIAMMQSFDSGEDDAIVKEMFFLIPFGRKIGEAWVDSTAKSEFKSKKTYTLKSVKDNIATVGLVGEVTGSTTMEMQGMQFDLSMNTKTTGEIIVDIKSGLVQKRNTNADISGNIDIMGQSTPITATATLTSEIKY